jgi:hypothetical protein
MLGTPGGPAWRLPAKLAEAASAARAGLTQGASKGPYSGPVPGRHPEQRGKPNSRR